MTAQFLYIGAILSSFVSAFPANHKDTHARLNRFYHEHNRMRSNETVSHTLDDRALPSPHIWGVNLGSWLVFEPYMAQDEWHAMGGDWFCSVRIEPFHIQTSCTTSC